MKKIFIIFLIFAFMNCYMGCIRETSKIEATYPSLEKSTNDFPLEVMTEDSVVY